MKFSWFFWSLLLYLFVSFYRYLSFCWFSCSFANKVILPISIYLYVFLVRKLFPMVVQFYSKNYYFVKKKVFINIFNNGISLYCCILPTPNKVIISYVIVIRFVHAILPLKSIITSSFYSYIHHVRGDNKR